MTRRFSASYALKILACVVAYPLGVMISGIAFSSLGIALPASPVPHAAPAQHPMLLMLAASVVLALGLMPLTERLEGSFASRAIILVVFVYVSASLNNVIEATRFMAAYAKGGAFTLAVFQALPCILFALALAIWIARSRVTPSFWARTADFFSRRNPGSWAWRMLVAVIGFPVIYFFFGLCVSPIVVPYYRASGFGLTIPSFATMISTATGRGALYLLATLPVLVLWKGTRRQLVVGLGLAFTVMVGWFPLLHATFLPPTLRVAHSVEICADSFAYAFLLVALLPVLSSTRSAMRPTDATQDKPAEAVG